MKVIFNFTLVIAIIISASIGCLVIFDVFTYDQGIEYIIKAIAAITLIGLSSAGVSLVTGNKTSQNDES